MHVKISFHQDLEFSRYLYNNYTFSNLVAIYSGNTRITAQNMISFCLIILYIIQSLSLKIILSFITNHLYVPLSDHQLFNLVGISIQEVNKRAARWLFSASASVVAKRTSTRRSATLAAVAKWTRQHIRLPRFWRKLNLVANLRHFLKIISI